MRLAQYTAVCLFNVTTQLYMKGQPLARLSWPGLASYLLTWHHYFAETNALSRSKAWQPFSSFDWLQCRSISVVHFSIDYRFHNWTSINLSSFNNPCLALVLPHVWGSEVADTDTMYLNLSHWTQTAACVLVHCLTSSVHRLRGLPRRLFPQMISCRTCVLSTQTTWTKKYCSFLLWGNNMLALVHPVLSHWFCVQSNWFASSFCTCRSQTCLVSFTVHCFNCLGFHTHKLPQPCPEW